MCTAAFSTNWNPQVLFSCIFCRTWTSTAGYWPKAQLEEILHSLSSTPDKAQAMLLILRAINDMLRFNCSHFMGRKLVLDGSWMICLMPHNDSFCRIEWKFMNSQYDKSTRLNPCLYRHWLKICHYFFHLVKKDSWSASFCWWFKHCLM